MNRKGGRRIGVVTAGGDAPGLNAAIRALGRCAIDAGDEVIGILNGWTGLLEEGTCRQLSADDFVGIVSHGGTILGSSRTAALQDEVGIHRLLAGVQEARLDIVVAMGGDGTLKLARKLAEHGLRVIGIPKTIDYDVDYTEICIGFESALSGVVEALDRLHTTAASHHRVMVLETMGRDSGWLATLGGLAGGADMICIPEFQVSIDDVAERLLERRRIGKQSSIVVVAEGCDLKGVFGDAPPLDGVGHPLLARRAIGEHVAVAIERLTGSETRSTVLGHLQRGGSPVASDRVWATRLGAAAADLARSDRRATAVAVRNGEVVEATLSQLTEHRRVVPESLYELSRRTS